MDLRANTAINVLVGPYIDSTDGDTEKTALTITQSGILLRKHGGSLAIKNDVGMPSHDANGYYSCPLDATDLNTEGPLTLISHETGALPVRHDYNVMSEAAWDSIYVAKDTGYMDVNVKAVSEDTTAADNLESACDNYNAQNGLTGTGMNTLLARIPGVLSSGIHLPQTGDSYAIVNSGTFGNSALKTLIDAVPTVTEIQAEMEENGASILDTLQDRLTAARAGYLDNINNAGLQTTVAQTGDSFERISMSGIGLGLIPWNPAWDAEVQSEAADALTSYDPPTKAELDTAIAGIPSASGIAAAVRDVDNSSPAVGSLGEAINSATAPTVGEVADAVWDEAAADHDNADSMGEKLNDAGAAADPWNTALPGSYAAGKAGYIIGTNLDAKVSSNGQGAGATEWTYTVTDSNSGLPIADVDVWVTSDAGGSNLLASGRTNTNGIVTFYLDTGTVYVWSQKSGYNFTNPDTEVVS